MAIPGTINASMAQMDTDYVTITRYSFQENSPFYIGCDDGHDCQHSGIHRIVFMSSVRNCFASLSL